MLLGIKVLHGRPYHPQTQGKEERFHRTLNVELLRRVQKTSRTRRTASKSSKYGTRSTTANGRTRPRR